MDGLIQDIKLIGEEIPWLKEIRAKGRNAFIKQGIPTPKTEAWKYTKPNRFFETPFSYTPSNLISISSNIKLPFDCYQINFTNGVFNPFTSSLPQGIEVMPIIEAIMFTPKVREKISNIAKVDENPFVALNTGYLNEGVYIHISSNVDIKKPLTIVYETLCTDRNDMYNLRNLIHVEKNSSVQIVEAFYYEGKVKSSYFMNVVNEIYLEENSQLKHYKIQDEAFKAAHIAFNAVKVEDNASYKSFCLQKGADMARNESYVELSEKGAHATVDSAYIMNGWATIDTTTNINHLKPYTTSSQLVKGVVGGQAKGVFQGKIHISPNAVKTEGYQLHKAMLLTDEAEVDVKPELEIFADDVKCSHGSACGELDKEQLFYMQSRGISEDEAKQMLIEAYLNDVIAKVDDEKIIEWIKLSLNSNKSE